MNEDKKYFFARSLCDTNLYKVELKNQEFRYANEVIIKTEFGTDLAVISSWTFGEQMQNKKLPSYDSGVLLRYATSEDKALRKQRDFETQAIKAQINQMKDSLGLEMQISHVLVPLTGKSICIYYVAKSRVDFRGLLIEMRSQFKEKVIMRHISAKERKESFSIDSRIPMSRKQDYINSKGRL